MATIGFWDFLRSPVATAHFSPHVEYIGGPAGYDEVGRLSGLDARSLTPARMWATQPHLRTVVSFVARNIAQLGLHSFERVGETDRRRERASAVAAVLRRPNRDTTCFELVYSLVGDLALYDCAYWHVGQDTDAVSGWTITRLPPTWVTPIPRDMFGNKAYRVLGKDGGQVDVPASEVLPFTGYHPSSPRAGSPTIESLKETLQEQIEASKFRNQVWKRGGRVSSVLERPAGSPQWSNEAREQFREDWYAKYTGDGPKAGGTPILEDGMTLNRIDFSASEQQWVEGAKLSFATVAAAFHVNPTMVGILDNANYSNVREFRRMLYGDTLGPQIAQIEDRLNTFLLPMLDMDSAVSYLEFNIAEKLQGSFEEQAAVMSTLVGRPIMSADEGRARFNLPAMGGDAEQLVTPLNVLVGGQASPRDAGTQNEGPPKVAPLVLLKAPPTERQATKAEQVLVKFFERQSAVILSQIGAGSDWWDLERWVKELGDDLLRLLHSFAETIGKAEAVKLGFDGDSYDPDRTVKFLTVVADRYADNVNATTKDQLDEALGLGAKPVEVFDRAKSQRAPGVGSALTTFAAGFGTREAALQIAAVNDVEPMKTWVTGSNPRRSHAAMNGETVPVYEPFSNGMQVPGEGGVDDVGCNCSISVGL